MAGRHCFGGLGLLIAFIVKEIPLREHLETEFGIVAEKSTPAEETGSEKTTRDAKEIDTGASGTEEREEGRLKQP